MALGLSLYFDVRPRIILILCVSIVSKLTLYFLKIIQMAKRLEFVVIIVFVLFLILLVIP